MKSIAGVRLTAIVTITMLGASAMGAEMAWKPVSATGGYSISGNEIFVAPGAQVTLEVRISGWDPQLLKAWEADVDPLSVTSGGGGSLSLLSIPDPLAGLFIDSNRQDFVFYDVPHLPGVDPSSPAFRVAAAIGSGAVPVADPGTPRYAATAILVVSIDARGTFTVGLLETSVLIAENNLPITPLTLTPARITIGDPCCLPGGSCAWLSASACSSAGGTAAAGCSGDTNPSNGVDDACEADCDGDGITDAAEAGVADKDCDLDGTCNGLDIASCTPGNTACADCNGNGVPDGCDLSLSVSKDCNGNTLPDECDIATMTSADCGPNGIPDECETGACCFVQLGEQQCTETTPDNCATLPGIYRGPCRACPTQSAAVINEPGGTIFVHIIGPPTTCPPPFALGRMASSCTSGPFYDPWASPADGSMCHNFGAVGGGPIPADFFGPGSDPFDQPVCLEGEPLGPTSFGDFGDADTIIERLADPHDRCELPAGQSAAVDIKIVELSLVSTSPITVTYNGGQNPEPWDVAVDLSAVVTPPAGTLTALKEHCNGGTYTSVLHVQPRFTFHSVASPTQVVFDTGDSGLPPVMLIQDVPAPWSHDVDPNLGLTGDPCSSFHAGLLDGATTTDCDCNTNLVRDKCDVESMTSQDCNGNAVPDDCDINSGTSSDVNGNNVPDDCDGPFCGDGTCDAGEVQCICPADCGAPPSSETSGLTCTDVSDNDCDSLTDCADPDCATDAACGPFCGDGNCAANENQCDCPADCGAPPPNEVHGSTCADNIDNDCDSLTDGADQDCGVIPAVSQWGLVVLTMLLLVAGRVYFGRRVPAPL